MNSVILKFIVVFFVYLYFAIKITQFPIFQTENMKEVLGGNIYASINMIPFKSIFNLTSLYNIILTVPVGLLMPVLKFMSTHLAPPAGSPLLSRIYQVCPTHGLFILSATCEI